MRNYRGYYKNLNIKSENLELDELELVIPEGFQKKLNDMEKSMLLDDQLLDHGLQLGYYIFGSLKIFPANKKAKHVEENFQISKRLREYIEKFNAM